jgi:hypothetical protein
VASVASVASLGAACAAPITTQVDNTASAICLGDWVWGEKFAFLFSTAANAKKVSYTYLNLTVAFR